MALATTLINDRFSVQIMNDFSVVSVYTDAYDGGLNDCGVIIDTHVRLLADALLDDNCRSTTACYEKLLDVRRHSFFETSLPSKLLDGLHPRPSDSRLSAARALE